MLELNHRDGRPIYEQVRDALRRLVVSGAMAEGEKLPSVRSLAASLAINPNTIQRAYTALEAEGYVVCEPGRGAFVAKGRPSVDPRREALLAQFDALSSELLFLGVTPEELSGRIREKEGKGETI